MIADRDSPWDGDFCPRVPRWILASRCAAATALCRSSSLSLLFVKGSSISSLSVGHVWILWRAGIDRKIFRSDHAKLIQVLAPQWWRSWQQLSQEPPSAAAIYSYVAAAASVVSSSCNTIVSEMGHFGILAQDGELFGRRSIALLFATQQQAMICMQPPGVYAWSSLCLTAGGAEDRSTATSEQAPSAGAERRWVMVLAEQVSDRLLSARPFLWHGFITRKNPLLGWVYMYIRAKLQLEMRIYLQRVDALVPPI